MDQLVLVIAVLAVVVVIVVLVLVVVVVISISYKYKYILIFRSPCLPGNIIYNLGLMHFLNLDYFIFFYGIVLLIT